MSSGAMSTDSDQRYSVDAIDENHIRTVVKLLLVAAGLVVLWGLSTALPGLDRLIPSTQVAYSAVAGAIVTLGLVVVVGYVAIRVKPLIKSSVTGPAAVVDDAANIVKFFLLFVAVIVSYRGFSAVVTPTLAVVGLVWVYDALFLVLALIPMVIIGVKMYENLEDATDLVVTHLTGGHPDGDRTDNTNSETE